ncbi:MAG: nucleotide exchange factor GrpE [Chloroflexota bacterium]
MAKKKPTEDPQVVEEAAPEAAQAPQADGTSPELSALIADLAEAQAKRDEYLDGWQRSIAEFSNYKKRVERDRELNQQNQIGSIVKRYLEIADDLDRALKARPQEGDGAAWANGIDLIYRKLLNILDGQGIKPMDVFGQPFDPNFHEAIGQMESSQVPAGHVAEVIQSGYTIGDRVLRPALVRIAS